MRFVIGLIIGLVVILFGVHAALSAELKIGQVVPFGKVQVCDTLEQARQVFLAHQKDGLLAARNVMLAINAGGLNAEGESPCGVTHGAYKLVRSFDSAILEWYDGEYLTTLVEIQNGSHVFYAFITGPKVVAGLDT